MRAADAFDALRCIAAWALVALPAANGAQQQQVRPGAARDGLRDTLRGRAFEHWDLGPSNTDRGAARAIRVRCP